MIYYTLTKYFRRACTNSPYNRLALQGAYMRDVIQYINSHYTEPITLKDVAQQYHVSCEHLSRVFKKNLGMTFKEYRQRYQKR